MFTSGSQGCHQRALAVGLKTLSFHFRLINGFDRSVLFHKIIMASTSISHRGVAEGLVSSSSTGALATGTSPSQTVHLFIANAHDAIDELKSDIADSTMRTTQNSAMMIPGPSGPHGTAERVGSTSPERPTVSRKRSSQRFLRRTWSATS